MTKVFDEQREREEQYWEKIKHYFPENKWEERKEWWLTGLPPDWKLAHFELIDRLGIDVWKYCMLKGLGLHNFLRLIQEELPPEGDILIAGTCQGGDVMAIRRTLPEHRNIVVIDSFAGLAEPVEQDHFDDGVLRQGAFACQIEKYRQNFVDTGIQEPDEIYKMWITPKSLKRIKKRPLAMVFTDLDHYSPAKACYERFIPWVVKDGLILTHDYEFKNTPGVTKAAEEYAPGQWKRVYGSLARLVR